MSDSAEVAGRLWDTWLPTNAKIAISAHLPGGDSDGKSLCQWLAGIHDIGKATPAFAIQVRPLANRMKDTGLTFRAQVQTDRVKAPHATAGMIILNRYLERIGWDQAVAEQFSIVVGGHHGMPPSGTDLISAEERPHLLGWSSKDAGWEQVQTSLLDWVGDNLNILPRLEAWKLVTLPQSVQSLLTGIVITADWIASAEELFGFDNHCGAAERAQQAWEELQLPSPWHASAPGNTAELFADRFALPAGATIRPVQEIVAETATSMNAPGLLIIEAPMGEGKTEAALAAAEILAHRTGAGGIFIGLPTRATSDAMFKRVLAWLDQLPTEGQSLGVQLAHGKARFNSDFTELFRRGGPTNVGIDEEGANAIAHHWTSGRKKALLSSFVIGTIDQLLFAALKTKHIVLRHLGLAGKIVIIDEAHAYDVFMSSFLDRALEWLASFGANVIVLSATLPAARRIDMLRAFDNGLHGRPKISRRKRAASDTYSHLNGDIGYPVITATGENRQPLYRVSAPSGRSNDVELQRLADDHETLATCLRRELANTGCALVIRNTVRRVQDTAEELRKQLPDIPISVAHSRFLVPDRYTKDTWLRDTFGSPEHLQTAGTLRPVTHIVVASQVAEQSLDIDFDVLVTDLAPVDLVLQRIGRLHRHLRDRPITDARCYLTGVDWGSEVPEPVRGSRTVYGEYALLRSLATLQPYLDEGTKLHIPTDIAPLVQAAYGEDNIGPDHWQEQISDAYDVFDRKRKGKNKRAEVFRLSEPKNKGETLLGWLEAAADTDDEESAAGRGHVRDDSGETLEVIVLVRRAGELIIPPWLPKNGGTVVPTDFPPPAWIAKTVATCTIVLPRNINVDDAITDLEQNFNSAWAESTWLDGQLVLELDDNGDGTVAGTHVHYSPETGLELST